MSKQDEKMNRTVCITGALSGLAKAIAKKCQEESMTLILVDINEAVIDIFKDIENVYPVVADVTSDEGWSIILKFVEEETGSGIDILFNCVSSMPYGDVLSGDHKHWQDVFDRNVWSTLCGCQAVIPSMVKRKYGKIINIGSIFSDVATYKLAAYSMSKAAITSLTKSIALDFGRDNIQCNCIGPGLMRNDFGKRYYSEFIEDNKAFIDNFANMPRLFVPVKDIADLAMSLIRSKSINGQTIYLDYGYTAR